MATATDTSVAAAVTRAANVLAASEVRARTYLLSLNDGVRQSFATLNACPRSLSPPVSM